MFERFRQRAEEQRKVAERRLEEAQARYDQARAKTDEAHSRLQMVGQEAAARAQAMQEEIDQLEARIAAAKSASQTPNAGETTDFAAQKNMTRNELHEQRQKYVVYEKNEPLVSEVTYPQQKMTRSNLVLAPVRSVREIPGSKNDSYPQK